MHNYTKMENFSQKMENDEEKELKWRTIARNVTDELRRDGDSAQEWIEMLRGEEKKEEENFE